MLRHDAKIIRAFIYLATGNQLNDYPKIVNNIYDLDSIMYPKKRLEEVLFGGQSKDLEQSFKDTEKQISEEFEVFFNEGNLLESAPSWIDLTILDLENTKRERDLYIKEIESIE